MTETVVRLATENDRDGWNSFLASRPMASPLALFEWRDVLAASYGPVQRFWMAERAGEIVGVLPTYRSLGWRNPVLYSLRHGLVAIDDMAAQRLLETANAEAHALKCRGAMMTSGLVEHAVGFPIDRRKTVLIDLSDGEPGLWKTLRRKTRPIVRKGMKANVAAVWSSGGIGEFYRLYSSAMAEKGVPILSRRFFDRLNVALSPHVRVLNLRLGGETIAGGVVFVLGKFATYAYQGARADRQDVAPNSYLFWSVAMKCIEEGITLLDLGESREGSPVYKFKTNFGGAPTDLAYYDMPSDHRVGGKIAATPASMGAGPSLRDKLIPHLPQSAKRWLSELARGRGRLV